MSPADPGAAPRTRTAEPGEVSWIAAVLAAAFADDPLWEWIAPDPTRRRRHVAPLFGEVIRSRVDAGWATVTEDRSGAAVWAGPGRWKASAAEQRRMALPFLRVAGARRIRSRLEALSRLEAIHPTEEHWYLEIVGVDPSQRGRGIGSAVIAPMLERCDAEGLPAYLESSNEANLPLYARFGFDVLDEVHPGHGCPPVWPMWRPAR